MVFSSHIFLFYFLPLALGLYFLVPRRGRHLVLTLLSYLFYGWANPYFTLLMLGSTMVDFVCGGIIARGGTSPDGPRSRGQRIALTVSIASNLALLGFFKYFNFGVDTWNMLVPGFGFETALKITLPLGISFYTFQSMSYTLDVFRGHARAVSSFIDFACYVSMFPQLVAGPIIRFQEVAGQLRDRTHTFEKFARGAAFITLGLAKKVLLANHCGKIADMAFDAGSPGFVDAWAGLIAYSFQIYFDFSGYSDMAIGLGLMLGFTFPKNFDSPYLARSITEFWRRWHISLSTWLRDYLYIPLGGNRKGSARTYVNLALVMLLGGLWHGASWNFVIWGGIHGAMLALERTRGKESFYRFLPGPLKIATTFLIVTVAWVFFRAETLPHAMTYLAAMTGLSTPQPGAGLVAAVMYAPWYLFWLLLAGVFVWAAPQTWDFTREITLPKAVWVLGLLWLSIGVLTTQSFNPFIYFIF